VARKHKTDYRLFAEEWNPLLSEVVLSAGGEIRAKYLAAIREQISVDMRRFGRIIMALERGALGYTADDVIAAFSTDLAAHSLFDFMEGIVEHLKSLNKLRTSETYAATLRSFKRFRAGRDLVLEEIDSDLVTAYEAYLMRSGVSPNSSSFYMRNLRAVYNRAVEKGLIAQRYPFKHVYTGVDKTIKRAISLRSIKQIKAADLSKHPTLAFARDMFLFSFYTRGMSFVDMAYLRKKDLNGGVLTYRRRKTGQQLFVKWERCMQEIVERYAISQSSYLLPIIKPHGEVDERKQYIYTAHNINRSLKFLGTLLDLPVPLTMYVSRHSWASIAKCKNIPISVISEGLGHDSESTTRIYLASLDTVAIDRANSLILDSL
jgi:integrase